MLVFRYIIEKLDVRPFIDSIRAIHKNVEVKIYNNIIIIVALKIIIIDISNHLTYSLY